MTAWKVASIYIFFDDKNELNNKPMRINYYIMALGMISKGFARLFVCVCHAVMCHVLGKVVFSADARA